MKREVAERVLQVFRQTGRGAVNVERFVSIGGIVRLRRDADIDRRALVEPPKEFGAGEAGFQLAEFLPNFPAMDEMVGLFPELDFSQFTIVPTVGDYAMLRRRHTCRRSPTTPALLSMR